MGVGFHPLLGVCSIRACCMAPISKDDLALVWKDGVVIAYWQDGRFMRSGEVPPRPPGGAPPASDSTKFAESGVEPLNDNDKEPLEFPRPGEYHVCDYFDELPGCTTLPAMQ